MRLRVCLAMCLIFQENRGWRAYKRVAYEKKKYHTSWSRILFLGSALLRRRLSSRWDFIQSTMCQVTENGFIGALFLRRYMAVLRALALDTQFLIRSDSPKSEKDNASKPWDPPLNIQGKRSSLLIRGRVFIFNGFLASYTASCIEDGKFRIKIRFKEGKFLSTRIEISNGKLFFLPIDKKSKSWEKENNHLAWNRRMGLRLWTRNWTNNNSFLFPVFFLFLFSFFISSFIRLLLSCGTF